jgi:hypothetical protein
MSGSENLKSLIERRIKSVFKTSLKCLELTVGKEHPGFEGARKEILRAGNDAIRDLREHIDRQYAITQKEVTVVKVEGKGS